MGSVSNLLDPEGSHENVTQHLKFWFDDGSIVFRVQNHLFKVHWSLLSRHSSFFAHHRIKASYGSMAGNWGVDKIPGVYIVVDPSRHVLTQDVEVLLEHLYHDV
jgi:hypothetical protein